MQRLIGHTDLARFEQAVDGHVLSSLPEDAFDSVLDFGCGCGRLARWLIQHTSRPRQYLGIDLHPGMIHWCQENLTPIAPDFKFQYQDVFHIGLNRGGAQEVAPFPMAHEAATLVIACSVFTHLVEPRVHHYLGEVARVLRPGGYFVATWFLFDKAAFPMMQEFQNALYINDVDPSNAVVYDRKWLREALAGLGLKIITVRPPEIRGFHWTLVIVHSSHPGPEVDLPPDDGEPGVRRPPLMPPDADKVRR